MKAFELYIQLYEESKNNGFEFLKRNKDALRFIRNQGISQTLWEDYDDPRLDDEVKSYTSSGRITNRLPNIGEWEVTVAVLVSPKQMLMIIGKKQVKYQTYHTVLPSNAFNHRNAGILYFTNESDADEFIALIKLSFSSQYEIVVQK